MGNMTMRLPVLLHFLHDVQPVRTHGCATVGSGCREQLAITNHACLAAWVLLLLSQTP
jgi:hypothetical protein